MEIGYTVTTNLEPSGSISSKVETSYDGLIRTLNQQVLDIANERIQDQLMRLGWLPPDRVEHLAQKIAADCIDICYKTSADFGGKGHTMAVAACYSISEGIAARYGIDSE